MYAANQSWSSTGPGNEDTPDHQDLQAASFEYNQVRAVPDASIDEEPCQAVLIQGSASLGQIDIVKQVHTTYREDLDGLQRIGAYQAFMLEHFEQQQYEILFVEGMVTSFEAGHYTPEDFGRYHYWLLPSVLRNQFTEQNLVGEIQQLFQQSTAGPLSDMQLQVLGALGAAAVYAIMSPSVSLYRTVSPEDERRIAQLQKRVSPQSSRYAFLRDAVRERLALNEVRQFLDRSPGARVALVYGALHDFTNQSYQAFDVVPLMSTIDWPSKRTDYTSSDDTA